MTRTAVPVVVVAAAIASLLGAGGVRAASGMLVDDDKVQCPTAQFTSIQAAVTAAAPGTTITVCPGSYSAVTVDKPGVTLVSSTGRPAVGCVDRSFGTNPARNAIVNGGAGTPGFGV